MEKNKTVTFNSSPLINLSHVGLLHLLSKLFTEIFIPEAVFKEVVIEGRKKEDVKEIEKLINDNVIKKIEVKEKELVKAFNPGR
jgi:predicted nucleic acid-binding protein